MGRGPGGEIAPILAFVEGLDSSEGIVALIAAGVAVLALGIAIAALVKLRRVRAAQRLVLGDAGARDLVRHAAETQGRVDGLEVAIAALEEALIERLADAERRLDGSVSKTAVIRYDAFNETSGRQSSTVALLDDSDTGVVISAILQREQARVYAKPVFGGRSELDLSPEEQEAMKRARDGHGRDGGRPG